MNAMYRDIMKHLAIALISLLIGISAGYIVWNDTIGGCTQRQPFVLYVTPTTYAYADDLNIMVWAHQDVTCGNGSYIDADHNCTIICGDSCYIDCYNDCVVRCGSGCEIAHGANCSITHGQDCNLWVAYQS